MSSQKPGSDKKLQKLKNLRSLRKKLRSMALTDRIQQMKPGSGLASPFSRLTQFPKSQLASISLRICISALLIFGIFVLGQGVYSHLLGMLTPPQKSPYIVPRIAVQVQTMQRADYPERLRAYGRARSLRSTVVSSEITGQVLWVSPHLQAGASIFAGESLVRLDDRVLVQAVRTACASLEETRAALGRLDTDAKGLKQRIKVARLELESAQKEYRRIDNLVEKGVLSPSKLDQSRLQVGQGERLVLQLESDLDAMDWEQRKVNAKVSSAEAALEKTEIDLSRTTILAPFSGRVENRTVQRGSRVGPGSPLFHILDLRKIEVPVALPMSRYGQVTSDSTATLRLPRSENILWSGQVARISPSINPADLTFWAYVEVETPNNEAPPLPPGAFVEAEVSGRTHRGVIAVPRTAFVGESLFVVKLDPENGSLGVVQELRPQVSIRLTSVALVEDGLETGDMIVITNLEQIAQGSKVQIVQSASDSEETR
ncbi:MAG: efflux RND transporter periplasmic adaptor subunit [Planctomycetota bacterium]|nr:efflux RND transporter periplasmic adaptor subunit [Planctomycetota bacterium]